MNFIMHYNDEAIFNAFKSTLNIAKYFCFIKALKCLISIYKGIPVKNGENLILKLKKSFCDYEFEEYYGGQYQYNYYITFE